MSSHTESITYSFKFDKEIEYLKACRGFTIAGAVLGTLGAIVLVGDAYQRSTVALEYDARIIQSDVVFVSAYTGLPVQYNVTYEVTNVRVKKL
jgi:hypothetical protein